MIAALVLLISCAATVELFAAYCRSILASTRNCILSDQARTVAMLAGNRVPADQFGPVMRLVKMCPELNSDSGNVAAVETYFRAVTAAANAARRVGWNLGNWAERERSSCAFFAAVALDRRISGSRDLLAQQMSNAL
jgi:hypothetical protein